MKRLLTKRGATFSPDPSPIYRYTLWRQWNRYKPYAAFIGLNPSTADQEKNDPTVKRCIWFAQDWGFGGLFMLNAFGLRSTDPAGLLKIDDPVGQGNDDAIYTTSRRPDVSVVVCAWGNPPSKKLEYRFAQVYKLLEVGHVLAIDGAPAFTQGGHPRHPLYVPKRATCMPFFTTEVP